MRIIVADPCRAVLRKRVEALSQFSQATREAQSGWALLWLLAEEEGCDLVISSSELPGILGVEVLTMIRAAGLTTPFVLLGPDRRHRRA
jgi:DNA-binding response OmpR family regulator